MKENNYERLTNTHSCMYDLNMITGTGKCTCMTKILNFLKDLIKFMPLFYIYDTSCIYLLHKRPPV